MISLLGETVTIIRQNDSPSGEDSQGNPVFGTTEVPVTGCAFAPAASDESGTTYGGRVISGGTVYAPSGTVFRPSDMLRIRGEIWQVDGEPGQWTSPFTGTGWGVEVAVKRGA
ncbi:hypothetical protein [Agromyces sp. SYSU T00194]|uniref:hypothetical protein n=1 Tax=Agromyces chitinivorans TaxID=3158560 RepID=UPI003390BDFF